MGALIAHAIGRGSPTLGKTAQEKASLADTQGKVMRNISEKSEEPLLGRNAYLWTFIPAVILLSIAVFGICFLVPAV